jgi:hypothetical protein
VKTKLTQWFDTDANEARYGIKVMSGGQWRNFALNYKPFIVNTKAEAEAMRLQLSKRPDPRPHP